MKKSTETLLPSHSFLRGWLCGSHRPSGGPGLWGPDQRIGHHSDLGGVWGSSVGRFTSEEKDMKQRKNNSIEGRSAGNAGMFFFCFSKDVVCFEQVKIFKQYDTHAYWLISSIEMYWVLSWNCFFEIIKENWDSVWCSWGFALVDWLVSAGGLSFSFSWSWEDQNPCWLADPRSGVAFDWSTWTFCRPTSAKCHGENTHCRTGGYRLPLPSPCSGHGYPLWCMALSHFWICECEHTHICPYMV